MRSNLYVISFMSAITVVLGLLLSVAATSLAERQEMNVQIDMKKNILSSLNIPEDASAKLTGDEIQTLFEERIEELSIDEKGNIVTDGAYSVFKKKSAEGAGGYAIPVSGKGLWSTVYGYLAIEPDGETVKGITFYKHGETPGLGGEIDKEWFTSSFVGKKIVDVTGNPVALEIIKGIVLPTDSEAFHRVDGISGATLTCKGVNQFLAKDLAIYEPFFKNIRYEGGK
ncbi:MAG: NADH:ubiquinone reductase (Na(+)-transporting) subunit C [Candidatus Marinimicrobia bacterium]|nr:NADH:ubiquinone reductase (Na(+)-transporting) subunit C [Candidatus Neomarinimicrobiota bacterium]MBL7059827.1 NADH:ubiquinone reductase (Na(+)-transporting) subunit C [Candidatus Neomarinimicrobiota bacterium]